MKDETIDRFKAQEMGLKRYNTGKPCKRGHMSDRHAGGGQCISCERILKIERYRKNPEKYRNLSKKWAIKAANNPAWVIKKRERSKNWALANKEKAKALSLAWAKKNPDRMAAAQARRKAKKRKATPVWGNKALIFAIYKRAKELSLEVDHVIPLQSNIVCGLHVPFNMQLLTKSQNSSKQNRFRNHA